MISHDISRSCPWCLSVDFSHSDIVVRSCEVVVEAASSCSRVAPGFTVNFAPENIHAALWQNPPARQTEHKQTRPP